MLMVFTYNLVPILLLDRSTNPCKMLEATTKMQSRARSIFIKKICIYCKLLNCKVHKGKNKREKIMCRYLTNDRLIDLRLNEIFVHYILFKLMKKITSIYSVEKLL